MQLELDINNILVSIVIPVYNVEKYLRQCIESVVNQTYQNIEIILVDDGSKDSSPNICDEYAKNDKRVTVIHQKNGGLSNARNSGTKVAKGEYIYFLDSDDYIELDMIEYLIGEIKICKADLLFFDSIVFKDKNAVTDFSNNYTRKYIYPMDTGINTITKLVENKEFKTPVQFLFIRKAILIENNLEFYDGILHEDGLFTVQLYLKCERVKYIPYQLYHRRIRDNSIMAQKMTWKNFHGYYIGCKELITLYNNLEKQSIEYKFLSSFLAKKVLSVLEIYYKLNKKDRKKEKSEYKDLILQAEKSDFFSSDKLERVIKHSLKLKVIVLIKKTVRPLYYRYSKNYLVIRIKGRIKRMHSRYAANMEKLKESNRDGRILMLCTPEHGNLGDHAIALSQEEFIKEHFKEKEIIEVTFPTCIENIAKMKKFITKDDTIIICGGGWLGTLWYHDECLLREIIKKYYKNNIIVMPQTIYYGTNKYDQKELQVAKKIYIKNKKLTIILRDKRSYEFCIKNELVPEERCFLLPDMVLFYKTTQNHRKNISGEKNAILCFRKDNERIMEDSIQRKLEGKLKEDGYKINYFTTVLPGKIIKKERKTMVENAIYTLSRADIVITDRLHCMLFCAISGTPCIAFDNLSNKISGVYQWIKDWKNIYLIQTISDETVETQINKIRNTCDENVLDSKQIEKLESIIKERIL